MALEPGARLGPYEIVGPAGAGGMGEVHRARDTRLDRTVAIKVLPPDLTSDPAVRHRFERDQPPTFTLTRDVPTLSRPSTVSMLMTRVPTGGTPQPNFRKNGSVREPPADSDIEPGIGI